MPRKITAKKEKQSDAMLDGRDTYIQFVCCIFGYFCLQQPEHSGYIYGSQKR